MKLNDLIPILVMLMVSYALGYLMGRSVTERLYSRFVSALQREIEIYRKSLATRTSEYLALKRIIDQKVNNGNQ